MNIEESIQQMGTLIEAWELDEAELNQTDINAMQVLLKEIQELELELSGYRQAILEDKDMLGLKEESEELKKQLKEYKRLGFKHLNDKCNKLENQQKDFIKYLEDEFTKIQNDIEKEIDNNVKYFKVERRQAIAKILQKYKEIIGDNK